MKKYKHCIALTLLMTILVLISNNVIHVAKRARLIDQTNLAIEYGECPIDYTVFDSQTELQIERFAPSRITKDESNQYVNFL